MVNKYHKRTFLGWTLPKSEVRTKRTDSENKKAGNYPDVVEARYRAKKKK